MTLWRETTGGTARLGRPCGRFSLHAVLALCLSLFAAALNPAAARAEEHYFPSLKFTLRLPEGWRLETIGGVEASEDDGLYHSEFQVEDIVRAPQTALASFTKSEAAPYDGPCIGLWAVGRGPAESPDIARSVLEGQIVEKSRTVVDPHILNRPRAFAFGATRVFFADMDYGVIAPNGREFGFYSQFYVVELKDVLLVIHVQSRIGDFAALEDVAGILGWLRVF